MRKQSNNEPLKEVETNISLFPTLPERRIEGAAGRGHGERLWSAAISAVEDAYARSRSEVSEVRAEAVQFAIATKESAVATVEQNKEMITKWLFIS